MAHFSFEDLEVWKKAVDFADRALDLTDAIKSDRKHFRIIEQIESAATSISMNIAEGKGRYSTKEFVQFLFYARGSLFETITLLQIFRKRGWIDDPELEKVREEGDTLGKMISGLINSIKGK